MRPSSFFCLAVLLGSTGACTAFSDASTSPAASSSPDGDGEGGSSGAGGGGQAGKSAGQGGNTAGSSAAGASGKAGSGGSVAGAAGVSGATAGGASGSAGGSAGQAGASAGGGGNGGNPGGGNASGGSAGGGNASGSGAGGAAVCQQGEARCQVGVVQECIGGKWELIENCLAKPGQICQNGACVADIKCGNTTCDVGESKCTCPADCGTPGCGECEVGPGDGVCNCGETRCTAPFECGQPGCDECGPSCGNGMCDCGESCGSCPQDCGPCQPVCGNGVTEAGEECDGQVGLLCGQLIPHSTGGSPTCTPGCTIDTSACEYCGNGKVDPGEPCEGFVMDASCASVGAGSGSLGCKSCQLDTSQCSMPSCGDNPGLDTFARWPAVSGCMRRPRRSSLVGPVMALGGNWLITEPALSGKGIEPVADEQGRVWHFVGPELVRIYNAGGFEPVGGVADPQLGVASSVLLKNGNMLALTQDKLLLIDAGGGLPKVQSTYPVEAPTTGEMLVVDDGSPFQVYYPDQAGIRLRDGSPVTPTYFFQDGTSFGGTMAYNEQDNLILAAQSECGGACQLYAISRISGNKVWQRSFSGGARNHVTVGRDGTVYVTGGSQLNVINPKTPNLSRSMGVPSLPVSLQPALRPDGSLVAAFTSADSASLYLISPQLDTLWQASLPAPLLAPPLLDADNNAYVCMNGVVASFDANGSQRWSFPLPQSSASCSMVISGSGRLDLALDNGIYRVQ